MTDQLLVSTGGPTHPEDWGRSRGVPLQDVQDALGHADPRTTRRYDRGRHNLDRSPAYKLAEVLRRQ